MLTSKYLRAIIVGLATALILWPSTGVATYDLPNDDGDCPDNCRQIPWLAGSDVWNGGTLPVYPSGGTCAGLTEGDGTTNNASAINACINAASANTAVIIPAGIYYVNGEIRMKDNVVLRGAGRSTTYLPSADASATTLKFGSSGYVRLGTEGNTDNGPKGTARSLTSGYTKGSQTVVAASGHGISTNDWVVIYEQPDSAIPVTATGTYGTCSWCGEQNAEYRLMSQIVQVTNVSSNTLTLSRPLYYTFKSGLSPGIRTYDFDFVNGSDRAVAYAGIEDMRLNGYAGRSSPHILMQWSLFNWVKNVEIYYDGDTAKAFHIFMQSAYGNEIRDSYIHKMRATSSDRAYGIGMYFSTSDNKIENNILRELRHVMVQEGGGSGNVFLYNYWDDIYTVPGADWLDGQRLSHGAHPYMTLVEGNIGTIIGADRAWGSTSHNVFFRNWAWGDLTGNFSGYDSNSPNSFFSAVRIDRSCHYFTLVGNVLGNTGLHTNWSNATMHSTSPWSYGSRYAPVVYNVGLDDNGSSYNSGAWDTLIKHGNYDYKTEGVAHWDGGSDHDLPDSMYYDSRPSWWYDQGVGRPWPPIGPDVAGYALDIPAKDRYEGETYMLNEPLAPSNLRIVP